MTALILQFVALALVIIAAGTILAVTADRIGHLTGLGGTLAGFLLLAGATSLPELVIDANAAMIGAVDLAVGDIFGSCIYNLLILGVVDLLHRNPVRIFSSVSVAHALSATTSMVLTGILLLGLFVPLEYEFLRIGLGPWMIVISYLLSVRLIFFDQRMAQKEDMPEAADASAGRLTLRQAASGFAVAGLLILACGPLLARVAEQVAEETGLGGTFVGTTFVALTTSLPEIMTTMAAVRMGAFELAAGNIFGSNCFNITILPVVDFFYKPGPVLQAVEKAHAVSGCSIIIITGLATMGLLYRAEKRYWILEPDALLVVLLSAAALVIPMFL